MYTQCKQDELRSKRFSQEGCRKYLPVITVDPKSLIPFIAKGESGYFAGVDFDKSYLFKDLKLKSFDCEKINTATAKSFPHAQFVLFGQDPLLFKTNLPIPMPLPKISPRGLSVGNQAKIIADEKGNLLLFPVLECTYKAPLQPPLQSLTVHFLLDFKELRATPYFGTVYFSSTSIKTIAYSIDALRTLGQPYKTLARKASGAIYLGTLPIKSYDSEGDPKDLCSEHFHGVSAPDPFMVLLKSQKDSELIKFASFVSVKNLCSFKQPPITAKE